MFKTTLRFIVIAVIALALGMLIYHLNQLAATTSVGTDAIGFGRDFGERSFEEGGFSLSRGVFGVAGDLILVAIVTVVVVSLRKALAYQPEPARLR